MESNDHDEVIRARRSVERMLLPQGDLRLLGTDLARALLGSTLLARLAYIAQDTPRVIPTWFVWTGDEVVMCTFTAEPAHGILYPAKRLAALRANPAVAITIDADAPRPQALLIRGRAAVTEVDGLPAEHVAATRRYLGTEAAGALLATADLHGTRMARIGVRPSWAGLLDFDTRLPGPRGGVQRPTE